MPDIEKTQCNYCGSQFLVIFEEEEEVIKYCPSCGEKIEDYIAVSYTHLTLPTKRIV